MFGSDDELRSEWCFITSDRNYDDNGPNLLPKGWDINPFFYATGRDSRELRGEVDIKVNRRVPLVLHPQHKLIPDVALRHIIWRARHPQQGGGSRAQGG